MKATKTTLVGGAAAKIATAGVSGTALIQTALTDLYLGDATVASDSAASFKFGTIATPVSLGTIEGDLWAISAAGGAVYVLQNE